MFSSDLICPTEFYTILIRLIKEYGGLFRLWIGPNLTIVVSDSKDVEVSRISKKMKWLFFVIDFNIIAHTKNKSKNFKISLLALIIFFSWYQIIMTSTRFIDKSPEYGFMKPWLNDGLLLSTGNYFLFIIYNCTFVRLFASLNVWM